MSALADALAATAFLDDGPAVGMVHMRASTLKVLRDAAAEHAEMTGLSAPLVYDVPRKRRLSYAFWLGRDGVVS